MSGVCVDELYDDEERKICEINDATKHIDKLIANIVCDNIFNKVYNKEFDIIYEVCRFWCGETYFGIEKSKIMTDAFQDFFESFLKLLIEGKNRNLLFKEKSMASFLYTGTVYRYLGNGNPDDAGNIIIPIYTDIFSSWSKKEHIDYITTKLYGTITHLTCEIREPLYGIDLDKLGFCAPYEKEVIFPTLEKCITKIEYLD